MKDWSLSNITEITIKNRHTYGHMQVCIYKYVVLLILQAIILITLCVVPCINIYLLDNNCIIITFKQLCYLYIKTNKVCALFTSSVV